MIESSMTHSCCLPSFGAGVLTIMHPPYGGLRFWFSDGLSRLAPQCVDNIYIGVKQRLWPRIFTRLFSLPCSMRYHKYPPPPALAAFVRCFWIMEGNGGNGDPSLYRLFASSCPELVVQYRNRFTDFDRHGQSSLSPLVHLYGQTQEYRETMVAGEYGIAGAYLYPYAVKALTGMPASEMSNRVMDMGSNDVAARMSEAGNDQARIKVFSDYLLSAFRSAAEPDKGLQACIWQLIHTKGATDIGSMADMLFVSGRQLERRFQQGLGLSPKLCSRIIRFQSTLHVQEREPGKRLTDIAYESGYFDQSHFIREFREFSGFSPKDYFMEDPDEIADSFIKIS